MREVVIVDSVRTGLAKSFRGKFNLTRPDDMAAHCVDALLARNDLDPLLVDDCIVGAGSNEGAQGHNIGRNVAVLSGLGIQVPGMTLNRYCSSGLQAIAIAANQIASGCSEVIVAGGVESITLTLKSVNTDHLVNPLLQREVPGIYYPMGQTAEIVARRYGITREAQDAYALQSQQRMARAQADGLFADEIVPMTTRYAVEDKASGEKQVLDGVVDRDDCNRPDTTLEGLASLKPAFAEDGSVTAGNASQLSDGASMTLLMSLEKALALGLEPKAFFRGFTVAGCEPDEMGIGPVFSVPKLLKAKGLKIADVDLWELNEAFASQCLYCRDRLEIDNEVQRQRRLHRHRPPVRHDRLAPGRSSGPRTAPAQPALRRGDHASAAAWAPAGCSKPYAEPVRDGGPAGRGSPHGFYLHDAPCHPRRLALG